MDVAKVRLVITTSLEFQFLFFFLLARRSGRDFVTIRLITCLMERKDFNKKSICTTIICAYTIEWPDNI